MPGIWLAADGLRRRTGAAASLAIFSTGAHAHSTAQGIGDFYAGFLHPLTAPEHVLPFFALGVLAAQQAPRGQIALPLFWVTLMAGAVLALWLPALPALGLLNVSSALVLGGLIAWNARLPVALLLAVAAAFGASHGIANGSAMTAPIRPHLFVPGLGLAALVTTGYGLVFTDWLLRRKAAWIHVAVRVAGSWIAAIGMLVLATSWKALSAG